jgi:hypothetical protein
MEFLATARRAGIPLPLREGAGGGFLAATIWLAIAGCQTPHLAPSGPVPQEGSAELVRFIGDQAFVTAEPGYRAIYALAKGEAFSGDFAALTDRMRADRLIGQDWNYAPDRCLDRATVAFMICRACKIESGVNWRLTGLGRYAWRELQFLRIAGDGSEYPLVSGGEFVGLLSRAEDYLDRTKRGTPPVKLGPRL